MRQYNDQHLKQSRRAGYTVLEIIVSMILLGVVLSMVAPMTKLVIRQRKQAEAKRAALFEVSNEIERLLADPATWPAPDEARTIEVSESLQSRFKEPIFTLSRSTLSDPAGVRWDASFSWQEPNGARASPITLSAFSFEDESGGAP